MKSKYPTSRKDKQQQIENLLKVYDFLGRQNRKKELPTAPERGESDVRTRKENLPKG